MDGNNKKISILLSILRWLEYIYLLTFVFIVYAYEVPMSETIRSFSEVWVTASYMILPVLMFKNVLVAILNNGILTKNNKVLILVRCILYVLLTVYSYSVVSSI